MPHHVDRSPAREAERQRNLAAYRQARREIEAGHDAPIALPGGSWMCHRCQSVLGQGCETCEGHPEFDEPAIPDCQHAPVHRP